MKRKGMFYRRVRYVSRLFFVFLWIGFFAPMYTPAMAASPLSIDIPASIFYWGDGMRLENVAIINGPSPVVEKARAIPFPKKTGYISREDIINALQEGGIGGIRLSLLMAERVPVLQEPRLPNIVRRISGWAWEVDVNPLSGAAPKDTEEFLEPGSLTPGVGSTTLKFRSAKGEKSVPVRINWYQPAVVLQRAFPRGKPLSEEDVVLRRVCLSQPGELPSRIEEVLGLVLRRDGQMGDIVSLNILETKPIILRGDRVIIAAQVGALLIEVPGEALDEGQPGDFIRVRNIASRTVVTGRVASPGRVEVDTQ
jgi:flagella basal body P-ring formation protein FlgA